MNHRDVDWLLGRSFEARFKVLAIDNDRMVKIEVRGQLHEISFDELQVLIERGLFVESADAPKRRAGWGQ